MQKINFVYEYLPAGKENAIGAVALAAMLGYRSKRALRAEIQAERKNGALILSSRKKPCGYFRPATGKRGLEEAEQYRNSKKSIAVRSLSELNAIDRELQKLPGQIAFPKG